jgi:uracil-DNA glycosylase family 4
MLGLLTSKPVLYVCNVEEGSAGAGNDYSKRVAEHAAKEGAVAVAISAKIESEIATLSRAERAEFLDTLGLEEAGLDRQRCYVTNAVKHFKFTPRGKRRLHAKPNAGEIRRCAWWLGAELNILQPKLVVTLGASALYALLGPKAKLTPERGHILHPTNHPPVLVTIHPSYLLRIRNEADRDQQRRDFVSDLHKAAEFRPR